MNNIFILILIHVPHVPRPLYGLMPRFLRILFPQVRYCFVICIRCVPISPFVLLSFYASCSYFSIYLQLVIFWGNLLKLKQIQFASNTLKRRLVFINSMTYLNFLKPNTKTCVHKTTNYFSKVEGEFKVRYNSHKIFFTPY